MEFLKTVFADKSLSYEEFVNACKAAKVKIADLSSGEYVAKGKYEDLEGKLKDANATIGQLNQEIGDLKSSSGDNETLQTKINELQEIIDKREQADKAATEEQAFKDRFMAAVGDNKFLNDLAEKGLFAEFKTAASDKANAGKSDADIFKGITEGRNGLFESPQTINIPGMGSGGSNGTDRPFDFDFRGVREKPTT